MPTILIPKQPSSEARAQERKRLQRLIAKTDDADEKRRLQGQIFDLDMAPSPSSAHNAADTSTAVGTLSYEELKRELANTRDPERKAALHEALFELEFPPGGSNLRPPPQQGSAKPSPPIDDKEHKAELRDALLEAEASRKTRGPRTPVEEMTRHQLRKALKHERDPERKSAMRDRLFDLEFRSDKAQAEFADLAKTIITHGISYLECRQMQWSKNWRKWRRLRQWTK